MMEKLSTDSTLSHNLQFIRERIRQACLESGRDFQEITLLAVTKTVDPDRINESIDLGVHHIGENRVQEYLGKKESLNLSGVTRHLIGHLQTNKVRQIVGEVDMIQSVDSIRVAEAIDRHCKAIDKVMPILVEVNIGGEEAKSGVSPEELEQLLRQLSALANIRVRGLMTVPPILHDSHEKREIFSKMYQLFVDIKAKNIDNVYMEELSMGMSDDYYEAILEGSTMVRIGSALFGQRQY